MRRTHLSAFSLIELSIVLVILGLLTGGILTGQSLIRAAELRSITSDFSKFSTATMAFKDKYFALPGDMNNATAFWGTSPNCPGNSTQGTTDGSTCNGDKNGQIDVHADSNESFRFWQHLANAGLIEGTFSGVEGSDGNVSDAVIGVNTPKSKMNNAGWMAKFQDLSSQPITSGFIAFNYRNQFTIGGDCGFACQLNGGFLSPEEAWGIDKKMDDELPARGKIFSPRRSNCSDGANAHDLDATYDLANDSTNCLLRFHNLF